MEGPVIKSTIYDLLKSGESASIQKAEPATLLFTAIGQSLPCSNVPFAQTSISGQY